MVVPRSHSKELAVAQATQSSASKSNALSLSPQLARVPHTQNPHWKWSQCAGQWYCDVCRFISLSQHSKWWRSFPAQELTKTAAAGFAAATSQPPGTPEAWATEPKGTRPFLMMGLAFHKNRTFIKPQNLRFIYISIGLHSKANK